ncbi:MAG: TetR/AcrR family transcriptional regulator [Thermodesulfobacteriota bacterium]
MERKPRKKIKTTKNLQGESTITRILNQAIRLFLEKGYHGTSIDDITEAAGITKGALYWHYKGKEDLLRIIIQKWEKDFLDGLIRKVDEVNGGAIDKFEKMFRYTAAFAYYNRELCVSFTTLAGELIGAHHGIESEIRRIYKKYRRFLSNLVLQVKREKIFKKDLDTNLTALVIMGFHDGILFHWSMNRDEIEGEAFVKTYKTILLNGLIA